MHADVRDAQLRQIQISRTANMAADQTTTDAYAQVPESVIDAERHNRARFIVTETGGANAIDARIVGRIKDDEGNWSAWQAHPGADASVTALAASGTDLLTTDNPGFDQLAVEIKANAGGSQGDVNVKGKSFFLDT